LILVIHHTRVARYADHVLRMRDGRLTETDDTPDEISE
jgi:ABC-type lipoprotein export system ATPase subunit